MEEAPASAGSAREWNFNVNGQYEGWNLSYQVNKSVSGGLLHLTTTAQSDPQLYSPTALNLDGSLVRTLELRLKNLTNLTNAKLYFVTNNDTMWDEEKSVSFKISANGGSSIYSVDLGCNPRWSNAADRVQRIRIDPLVSSIVQLHET